jgi:seryl-tRNA synthetase
MPTETKTKTDTTTQKADQTDGQTADGVAAYARQAADTAVSAVDLPVGAALTAADRVRDLVQPWRHRETAEEELKNLRHQLNREVNKVERRGGTARRDLTQRVERTRGRVERTVTENRRKAEERVRNARVQVSERVPLV